MAYLGFHKEGGKFLLATSAHIKGEAMFFLFFPMVKNKHFFDQGVNSPLVKYLVPYCQYYADYYVAQLLDTHKFLKMYVLESKRDTTVTLLPVSAFLYINVWYQFQTGELLTVHNYRHLWPPIYGLTLLASQ